MDNNKFDHLLTRVREWSLYLCRARMRWTTQNFTSGRGGGGGGGLDTFTEISVQDRTSEVGESPEEGRPCFVFQPDGRVFGRGKEYS